MLTVTKKLADISIYKAHNNALSFKTIFYIPIPKMNTLTDY